MDFQYTCHAVKFDPGEDLKTEIVLIFDFEMESRMLRKFVKHLIVTPFLLPIKTIEFIDKNIGKFSDFYYGEVNSLAEIEFINQTSFMVFFENDRIRGFIRNEELSKWGIKSIREMFEGDTINSLVLTNYCYGKEYPEATDAYCISLALKGRGINHV